MTTKHSPLSVLTKQAEFIAGKIKAWSRGEVIDPAFAAKLAEAREHRSALKVGLVMDDKIVTLDLPWATIESTGEVALAAYVLKLMREERTHG